MKRTVGYDMSLERMLCTPKVMTAVPCVPGQISVCVQSFLKVGWCRRDSLYCSKEALLLGLLAK